MATHPPTPSGNPADDLVDTLLDLWDRKARLLRRRDDIDGELVAIENTLRDRGAPGMTGRPRKAYTQTREEATAAHARYAAGTRDAITVQGEREYGRRRAREARLRARSQGGARRP